MSDTYKKAMKNSFDHKKINILLMASVFVFGGIYTVYNFCFFRIKSNIEKEKNIDVFRKQETSNKLKKVIKNDSCSYQIESVKKKIINSNPPIYNCLEVLKEIPVELIDSIEIYQAIKCEYSASYIDSMKVFFKLKTQTLKFELAKASYNWMEPISENNCVEFKHCNDDDYLDLVICSGRSGNGHRRVEICVYNPDLQIFEYDEILSNIGSICYDQKNDVYQSYVRGGQMDFLFQRFRLDKARVEILEELDFKYDQEKSNRDSMCVIVKYNLNDNKTTSFLCFDEHSDIRKEVMNFSLFKRFKDFEVNYKLW